MIPASIKLAAAPYLPWIKLAACIALVGFGWWLGSRSEAADHAQTKAEHAQVLQRIAEQARDAAEKTRQAESAIRIQEHQMADEVAAIANAFEEDRHAIETNTRSAVLADLRAGRVQLRVPPARCPVPASAQAPAAAGIGDGDAPGGSQGAADLAGGHAEQVAEQIASSQRDDAQLAACQQVIRAYTTAPATGVGKP